SPDPLVRGEKPPAAEDPAVPAVHAVAGDGERTLVEGQAVVVERRQVEVGDRSHALAARAHAAEAGEGRLLPLRLGPALDRDRTGSPNRGDVEGERVGWADMGVG